MTHLTNETEITFDIISDSDVRTLSASTIMLRDRFGGFLHVEATKSSEASEVYVMNKDCPPPLHYFLHYAVIISNSFAIGNIYPRIFNFMLVHALRYEDKLKFQLFFTNSLESAERKACIMEGRSRMTPFQKTATKSNSKKWLEVLKKHIGKKISIKPSEIAAASFTAVREFYAVLNGKDAEGVSKSTEKALQASMDEFSVSPQVTTASLSDQTFGEFVDKFIERSDLKGLEV